MKFSNFNHWQPVIECAVIGLATLLNPQAVGLLFLLRLSFQVLWAIENCLYKAPISKNLTVFLIKLYLFQVSQQAA